MNWLLVLLVHQTHTGQANEFIVQVLLRTTIDFFIEGIGGELRDIPQGFPSCRGQAVQQAGGGRRRGMQLPGMV